MFDKKYNKFCRGHLPKFDAYEHFVERIINGTFFYMNTHFYLFSFACYIKSLGLNVCTHLKFT